MSVIYSKDFLNGLAIIGAAEFADRADQFSLAIDEFSSICQSELVCSQWISIDETITNPHFEQYMPYSRWKNLRHFFPEILFDATKK
jgi:hypothetical protein